MRKILLTSIASLTIFGVANADTVAKIGDTEYESLIAAIDEVQSNETIIMQKDVKNGAGKSVASESNFTIDFGGKTYSAYEHSAGSSGTATQIFQLNKNSTITFKNGKIDVAEETAEGMSGNFLMGIQNYSNLTLDNMIVDGTNLLETSRKEGGSTGVPRYTMSNNHGDITIKDSTIIAKAGGFAFDVCNYASYGGTQVTLSGGNTILGDIEIDAKGDPTKAILITKGTNFVSGNILNYGGTVNIGGDLTLDNSIYNAGAIEFKEGSSLKFNLETFNLIAGTKDSALGTVTGTTQLILDNSAVGKQFTIQASENDVEFTNPLYNIASNFKEDIFLTEYTITKKSTSEVATSLAKEGVNVQQAAIISAFADSTAGNPILDAITEAVQSGEAKAAAKLAEGIAPTTSQTVMGVAEGINSILSNVADTRMAAVGRSGGDTFVGGSVWAQGLMNHTKQDSTDNNAGFSANTSGISFGIDGKINKNLMIGIGYGYTNTNADSGGRDIDVKGHNIFAYTEYKPNNWYINGMFSYGINKYDETKVANLGAKYDVNTYAANIMTGYDFDSGITPEVGLRYLVADQKSYNDGLQTISADNTNVLTGVVGFKYKADMQANDWTFTPNLRLAATYDMISDDSKANVSVIGGGNYQITGESLEQLGVEAGIGLETTYQDWTLSVNYNTGFRKDFQSHTGMLRAKYNF